mgnify:CR=1 FL=1
MERLRWLTIWLRCLSNYLNSYILFQSIINCGQKPTVYGSFYNAFAYAVQQCNLIWQFCSHFVEYKNVGIPFPWMQKNRNQILLNECVLWWHTSLWPQSAPIFSFVTSISSKLNTYWFKDYRILEANLFSPFWKVDVISNIV